MEDPKKPSSFMMKPTMDLEKDNLGFEGDSGISHIQTIDRSQNRDSKSSNITVRERAQWGSSWEFLMSCIAMSVGLGNIWRFPFTALENGGGAFIIPYLIVLIVIGRPLYYMEMGIGQFTSQGAMKIWSVAPALGGVGVGQIFATLCVASYYCAIMAIILIYLIASFQSQLPWTKCQEDWANCYDGNTTADNRTGLMSSSELYFRLEVLREKEKIDDGLGDPDWKLALGLLFSWTLMFLVLCKGIKSSGKASYFLALFPYVILITLFIRGVTLPGALDGIIFFFKPQWDQLLDPKIWYAAVTQCFYSLTVCFGALITYSSYNGFRQNIYRDALIVSVLDTFTSLIAGCTIFSILGNLAYESGITDIASVTKGGTGLAFISYPEAISKFDVVPQLFSVLFFFMLYILGIGSAIACLGAIVTFIMDNFPELKFWKVALVTSIFGFLIGLLYVTPGGQFMLNLVDYYGSSFNVLILACIEIIGIIWVYGLENFCDDMEFMTGMTLGIYWRLCWGLFTPLILLIIAVYSFAVATPLSYGGVSYPESANISGWLLLVVGVVQPIIWAGIFFMRTRGSGFWATFKVGFRPSADWGPRDPAIKKEWEQFKRKRRELRNDSETSLIKRIFRTFWYSKFEK